MPRLPQPGSVIKGYKLTEHLNAGAMANAFAAISPSGSKVFFKQYKSPSVAVSWFKDYVAYNKELNRRISTPRLQRFCVRNIESFEEKFGVATYFQVYEFVEGGHDLGTILAHSGGRSGALDWKQRLTMAKVIMAAIDALHAAMIVHADLKPANIQMLRDPSIRAGYQPKLIDMDRSVLADCKPPWDGHETYVGTPRYFSPEHLAGLKPVPSSDIFTCGIILHELLAGKHPFPADDDEGYKRAVLKNSPPLGCLLGPLPERAHEIQLTKLLQRCLSTDVSGRPSALEVNEALNGKFGTPPPEATALPPPASRIPSSLPLLPEAPKAKSLVIRGLENTSILRLNLRTDLGRNLLRQFGPSGERADPKQCVVEPRTDGWWIEPIAESFAWTTLNGATLTESTRLRDGDTIGLQGRKSGKQLSCAKVSFE